MLTQKKNDTLKRYWFVLLMLLLGTLAMKPHKKFVRIKNGDITKFMGNKFEWKESEFLGYDTVIIEDPETSELIQKITKRATHRFISKVNERDIETFYPESGLAFAEAQNKFSEELTASFKSKMKNINSNLGAIILKNVVIDKNGKIIYWDKMFGYHSIKPNEDALQPEELKELSRLIDGLIADAPLQKAVSRIATQGACIKQYGLINFDTNKNVNEQYLEFEKVE